MQLNEEQQARFRLAVQEGLRKEEFDRKMGIIFYAVIYEFEKHNYAPLAAAEILRKMANVIEKAWKVTGLDN